MDWDELEFFQTKRFRGIIKFLKEEETNGYTILPDKENILNALYYTPLEEVKCVILGQDPYPTPGHPIGLSFAVRADVQPLPKSLINIFNELKDDVGTTHDDGDLTGWANQGVLLLNAALTVRAGYPGSHSSIGWLGLTKDVIRAINVSRENVVFILWGKNAQELGMFIDQSKHHILKAPHPSPLSAYRGFFGSKPFSQTNNILQNNGIKPIQW